MENTEVKEKLSKFLTADADVWLLMSIMLLTT